MPTRMKDCEHCGYAFPAKSRKARFCSDAHRSAAGRARRNEEALLAEQQPPAPAPEPAPMVADLDQLVAAVAARLGLATQPLEPALPLDDEDDDEPQPTRGITAGPVETATRRTLEDAARAETPLGLAAIVLAQRLDNAHGETGGALRSLGTGLRELMTSAMERAGAVPTPSAGGDPDDDEATTTPGNVSPIEARRLAAEERRRQALA